MFTVVKYTQAVIAVLSEMRLRGIISRETEKEMGGASLNDSNREYGVELIKYGRLIGGRYQAVAVVFARLYLAASRHPRRNGCVGALDWQRAGEEALKKSNKKLNDIEAELRFEGLAAAIYDAEKEFDSEFFGLAK